MSIQFHDSTTYKGLVQFYEKEIGVDRGFISGDTDRLKEFTAAVNSALDDFTYLAIKSSGLWQWDDSNQTDYPIITTNIVSGQRDYSFATDANGNAIIGIYRVLVANSSGIFSEIDPVDQQTPSNNDTDTSAFLDGRNGTGIPTRYDKTANGIFLDPIPNYNYTNGIKILINREASYFTYTDTTRKPGVPGIFHKYFALKPALDYARRHNLSNLANIEKEVIRFEGSEGLGLNGMIQTFYNRRDKSIKYRMVPNIESTR